MQAELLVIKKISFSFLLLKLKPFHLHCGLRGLQFCSRFWIVLQYGFFLGKLLFEKRLSSSEKQEATAQVASCHSIL